uniref:Uncharacterized protein n=1 Tax=Populus trichocarpa TaxID=3694 RepID=B9GW22_POPTR
MAIHQCTTWQHRFPLEKKHVPYQDIQARSTFGEVEREESQENITAAGLIKLSTDLNQFLRIPFRHFFSIKLVSKTFPDTVKVIHDEPQGVNSINKNRL